MLLKNPKYYNALKRQANTRWLKQYIEVPTLTSNYAPAPHTTSIALRPHQKEAYNEVVDYTSALVVAKTGWGKTVLAAALHQSFGGKTLIALHSLTLVKQFTEEFEKFIGVTPTWLCNGKKDLRGDVVLTTHTTLRREYKILAQQGFRTLLIDEADLMQSDKSLRAILTIAPHVSRIVGMTGTDKTDYDEYNDIEGRFLGAFYGRRIDAEHQGENPLKGVYKRTYNKVYTEHGAIIHAGDWIKCRSVIDGDIDRKRAQLAYVLENTDPNGQTLLLFDRLADVESFYTALKKRGYNAYIQHGQMIKRTREKELEQFKETGGYLVGQTKTLDRGYDNTLLTKVFILFPIKGENPIRQIFGRILRYFEGKESYVYLWADSTLKHQTKEQNKIIKEYYQLDVIEV
jgi:superfamily II DNA or RNA helicase